MRAVCRIRVPADRDLEIPANICIQVTEGDLTHAREGGTHRGIRDRVRGNFTARRHYYGGSAEGQQMFAHGLFRCSGEPQEVARGWIAQGLANHISWDARRINGEEARKKHEGTSR
jgi:hypothetical protein